MKIGRFEVSWLWIATVILALVNLVTGNVLAGYALYFILGFRVGGGWKAYMVQVVEQGEKWKREWGLDKPKVETPK